MRFGSPGAGELMGLGGVHMLTGWDHLAFIMGLVLLCRQARTRVLAIAGFTAGHAAALLLAAVSGQAPSQAVEIWIALSIVWIARETLRESDSVARRRPALISGLLGLVHGMGFASIIGSLELDPTSRVTDLLQFNLGAELVQLLLALPLALLLPRLNHRARHMLAVVLGGLGVFWLLRQLSGG